MMKTCSRCKQEKPKSEFYKQTTRSDGLRSRCKACDSELNSEYYKQNRQKMYESNSEYCRQNKRKIEDRRLHRRYGISIDDYDRMSATQGHKCAICGSKSSGGNKSRFCVDHDHETGQVRALLCNKCNQGIGLMQDDPDLLEKAADYIRAFQGNR